MHETKMHNTVYTQTQGRCKGLKLYLKGILNFRMNSGQLKTKLDLVVLERQF